MTEKLFLATMVIFLSSCTSTVKRDNYSFEFFTKTIESKSDLFKKWGTPTESGETKIDTLPVNYYRYRTSQNNHLADFLADITTGKILEKSYSPKSGSEQSNLDKLISKYFSKIKFEKVPVKCRHHKELLLVNKNQGVAIVTQDAPNASVVSVAFSSKKIIELQLQAMEKQKCRYH